MEACRQIILGILSFSVDREVLGSVFRDTAELAGIAETVAFVALFVRNAAGSGSLFCLSGSTHEPLPVTLLFRGDLDPLLEWAVVDGGCVLICIVLHENGSFQICFEIRQSRHASAEAKINGSEM